MTEAPTHRLAAMTGLALAAAIAVWWLGSTRLALDHGADAGRSGADALHALLLIPVVLLGIVLLWRRHLGLGEMLRAGQGTPAEGVAD